MTLCLKPIKTRDRELAFIERGYEAGVSCAIICIGSAVMSMIAFGGIIMIRVIPLSFSQILLSIPFALFSICLGYRSIRWFLRRKILIINRERESITISEDWPRRQLVTIPFNDAHVLIVPIVMRLVKAGAYSGYAVILACGDSSSCICVSKSMDAAVRAARETVPPQINRAAIPDLTLLWNPRL